MTYICMTKIKNGDYKCFCVLTLTIEFHVFIHLLYDHQIVSHDQCQFSEKCTRRPTPIILSTQMHQLTSQNYLSVVLTA